MRRVLIVEDDIELAHIIQDKVQHLCRTEICGSGYQAMNLLQEKTFDLVITDYHMADGDGASLAHYCAERGLGVIVVSSFPEAHIKPYLPHGTLFLNKFHAVCARTLEELVEAPRTVTVPRQTRS